MTSNLVAVYPVAAYKSLIKHCIWRLKFGGARSIATTLVRYVPILPTNNQLLIVPVPTASSRRRQRGYEQAVLLARALAGQRHLPYANVLRRSGHTEQLGASRQQRLEQLQSAYRCTQPKQVQGRHILLVDDVMTTGATLESAAGVLLKAGAATVSAAVIAQA